MLYALGKRDVVHPALGAIHPVHGTPWAAIGLVAVLSTAGAMLGDAILVPVTEVGSLTVGIGWLSACAAFILRRQQYESAGFAWTGVIVAAAIILMKIAPGVPGSFGRGEWIAFVSWSLLGLVFWLTRRQR
jgi:hypothetical protein